MSHMGLIFLNGDAPSKELMAGIHFQDYYVVCADGAYDYLKEYCKPNLIVGDMDSVNSSLPSDVPTEKYSVNKNYTDSEIALMRAIQNGCKKIDIYGAFGGRPDHEIVNYSLLAYADSVGAAAVLRGNEYDLYYVTPQKPFVAKLTIGKTVSLVPFSNKAHILYTKGLKFSAADVEVDKLHVFTVSNSVSENDVEYCLKDGTALLFVQN